MIQFDQYPVQQNNSAQKIVLNRCWAMPSRHTFKIKPIAELIGKYINDGIGWIDPFGGENSPAEITNDLNPNKPTTYHN